MKLVVAAWCRWLLVLSLLGISMAGAVDWRLGDRVYRNVRVREVTPRAVIILHDEGVSQVLLRDLPPEVQRQFGYDPAADIAEQARVDREDAEAEARVEHMREVLAREAAGAGDQPTITPGESPELTRLKHTFAHDPVYRGDQDLRPQMRELGLFSKSQGRRPSCSVFAVVGALEFLASRRGEPVQFSEDYAIWATRQYLSERSQWRSEEYSEEDAGFRLTDVVQALEHYGLVEQESMPNTFGTGMARIQPPEPELLECARQQVDLEAFSVITDDPVLSIKHLLHCLNAGQPVVIGLRWPNNDTLRSAPILSRQTPVSLHAVTLVGYRADPGGVNLRFVFKNSWGSQWGSGGYGWVTADYLRDNLQAAYVLDPDFGE